MFWKKLLCGDFNETSRTNHMPYGVSPYDVVTLNLNRPDRNEEEIAKFPISNIHIFPEVTCVAGFISLHLSLDDKLSFTWFFLLQKKRKERKHPSFLQWPHVFHVCRGKYLECPDAFSMRLSFQASCSQTKGDWMSDQPRGVEKVGGQSPNLG